MNGSDNDRSNRAQALLEALPQGVYRVLPSARTTSELCSNAVARAIQFRNPGAVNDWLEYEKARASTDVLLSVLTTAVDLEVQGSAQARVLAIAERIVEQARRYLTASNEESRPTPAPSATNDMLDGLLTAIATFDETLYRHSLDVAGTARRLACTLDCSADQVQLVWDAARAHEIGRLRVERALLQSPRRLNQDERDAVRRTLGDVRALRKSQALENVADVVSEMYCTDPMLASHAASILKVADGFHSMCEARPYRAALGPQAAIEEILRERGTVYDGRTVDALASMLGYSRPYAWSA